MPKDSAAVHSSIQQLAPEGWNALGTAGNPFTRHEFLAALEREQCVGAAQRLGAALLHPERCARPLRRRGHLHQAPLLRGVRVRLRLGARLRARRAALLPQTHPRRSLHAGDRPAAADAAGPRRRRGGRTAAAGARALCARPRPLGRARAVSRWTRARGVRAARLAAAARLPVPLAEPRLRQLRGVPRKLHGGEAQEGAARASPGRRGRHALRDALRRRAR